MRMRVVIALTFVLASAPVRAGEASGEFTVGARAPIRPRFAVAFDTRDQRDARKHAIEVVLSEEPVDIAAAVDELDPHSNVINQPALREHNYVLLWVRPDDDVSMNATYSERMSQYVDMTGMGSLRAQFTSNTADNVAGRVFTEKPVKTGDESYSADLKFSTKVTRRAVGTKLPAGGGPAGKSFLALVKAISAKSWPGILQNVTPDTAKKFNEPDRSVEENLQDAVSTFGFWLPKKGVKVTGGELHADSAVLEVEGEIFEGQKALYLVRMVRSDSRWLFDRATKAGLID